jgi:hypothetical protein
MPSRKATAARRQQRPAKRRLLDGVTPKKSKESATIMTTPVFVDLVTDGSQSQSPNETVTASSSMLKRHEEEVKKKNQKLSPDPTLPSQQQQQHQLISELQ